MDLETVERVVALMDEYPVSEITVEREGQRLSVRKPFHPAAPAPAVAAPTAAAAPAPEAPPPVAEEPLFLTAPMVGLFHHAEPPLGYGTAVEAGEAVGSIEAMKLMNDVLAETGGVVVEVLIEDGAPVEYGQPLFRLMSAAEMPHV